MDSCFITRFHVISSINIIFIGSVSELKGHSGNIFGGVFSSWGPYMAPKEWGIAKTRPKKSIYEAREGQVCLLF